MPTWTVRALKYHTYKGVEYQEKDLYTVSEPTQEKLEQQVENLQINGWAHRIDPTDQAEVG